MRRLVLAPSLGFLLAGCHLFSASRRVDAGPFAENLMQLVSVVQPGQGMQNVLFIRPYLPVPSGEVLNAEWEAFQDLLGLAVEYAHQLAAIAESPLPEERRAAALADFLERHVEAAFARDTAGSVDEVSRIEEIVVAVRSSSSLLEALQAAQAVADELLRRAGNSADRIREASFQFGLETGAKIDASFAGILRNLRELEELQEHALRCFTLLTRARSGDTAALADVRRADAHLASLLGDGTPSDSALSAAEAHLEERLARIEKFRNQITPEVELYVRTKAELSRVLELSDQHSGRGRVAVIAFARAHRNLAAGLVVPPEIDVLGALRSAVEVVP